MQISIDQVKDLRDQTGVSVMQCRKALEEAAGDMEKALMILKKKSSDIAAKKSDRTAADGLIVAKQSEGKAAIVVLNCETDFVARNDEFVALANAIADKALADGEEAARTDAAEKVSLLVQKIGENIQLGRVTVITGNPIGLYIHNGKSGALAVLEGGTEAIAKDIAMHAAAMKPAYIASTDVPADMRTKAEEIFAEEVNKSDKPEDIKKKMLEGKIATYFKEQSLLDQPFIKDQNMTVATLLSGAGAKVKTLELLSLI